MSRTLIFCTCYSDSAQTWTMRYRLWLNAILGNGIAHDHVLIVDDASPVPPDWSDTRITGDPNAGLSEGPVTLFRFDQRLGRQAGNIYPGWSRSFCFAARFARAHGFDKVIHIESDAFIVSAAMERYFNEASDGWIAQWYGLHHMPESAIQIMAGNGLRDYFAFADAPYSESIGIEAEHFMPFTHVEKSFIGSRYGETEDDVPRDADFVAQSRPAVLGGRAYFWWLRPDLIPFP